MKKFFIISLFLINASICAMQQEEQSQTKMLVKQAWREAYEGNFSKSKEYFHEAVNRGDLGACLYLAQEYSRGGLIVPYDMIHALYFLQKVESLKQESREEYNATLRVPDPERELYWYDRFIKRVETKNTQRHSRIQASLYARENPWYQQVVEILKKEHEKEAKEELWVKKNFKILLPQEGICKLLDLYSDDKIDGQWLPLLSEGIRTLNTDVINEYIFNVLKRDYPKMVLRIEKRKTLLPFIQDWALKHDKREPLEKIYESYLYDNISTIQFFKGGRKQKIESYKNILEAIPFYFQLNPSKASENLKKAIKFQIKIYAGYENQTETLLKFLTCMHNLNPPLFEHSAQKIVAKNLCPILALVLQRPELVESLEGTCLAITNLIEKALDNALQKDGDSREAFEVFLKQGKLFHEQYKDRIISIIPVFIQAHSWRYEPIVRVVESPIKALRLAAFKALTEYYTSPHISVDEVFERLFELSLNDIIGEGRAVDAYQYFYELCKKNDCVLGRQYLWLRLAKSNNVEERKLLVESMHEFFELQMSNDDMQQPFEAMLNNALQQAMQTNSVASSRLAEFFMQANETGIEKVINPHIHENFKMNSMIQESTSIKQRCQFLDDLLCVRLESEDYHDIIENIEKLSDSPFKEYAKIIITIIQPQSNYKYFQSRRMLNNFCEQNKDFDQILYVLRSLPEYYNAFCKFVFQSDVPKVHKSLEQNFINPLLSEGLIIGYVPNDDGKYHDENEYRLYACDVNDGYVVWKAPFTVKETRKFVMNDSAVCCVTDDDKIVLLNRNNGSRIMTVCSNIDEKISSIAVTASNILFIVYETKLCIADCAQKASKNVLLPKRAFDQPYLVGEKIAFKSYSEDGVIMNLILIDKDGRQQTVTFDVTLGIDPFFEMSVFGNEKVIFYTYKLKDHKGERVVCLNYDTGQKLWEYEMSKRIKDFCYAKKADKLFLLTGHKLIALDTLALSDEQRISWCTPILRGTSSEIYRIIVSDDEAFIYGIEQHDGNLFQFDSKNGDKQHLYAVKENRAHRLIGACNGKVYVQPYHY